MQDSANQIDIASERQVEHEPTRAASFESCKKRDLRVAPRHYALLDTVAKTIPLAAQTHVLRGEPGT